MATKPFVQPPAAFPPKYAHDGHGTYTLVEPATAPTMATPRKELLWLAFEFGYKSCEKGMNIRQAAEEFEKQI
jgi:hypothetical protein